MSNENNRNDLIGWLYETKFGFRITVTDDLLAKLSAVPVGSSLFINPIDQEKREASAAKYDKEVSKTAAAKITFALPREQTSAPAPKAVASKPAVKAAAKVERF